MQIRNLKVVYKKNRPNPEKFIFNWRREGRNKFKIVRNWSYIQRGDLEYNTIWI